MTNLIELLHAEAQAKGDQFYKDPETGDWVATAQSLLDEGECCYSDCRHCPYTDV